ncbi:unnamed protein product, partial [Phaeothamnion confervicola]
MQAADFRLTPADEFTHTPTADSNFNESVYVNGFDPKQRSGGWMRIGNRVNEGYAEAQVCLYLPDGRLAVQFQRPDITHNKAFAAGGLSYTVHEPYRHVSMRYEGDLLVLDDPDMLRDARRLFAEAPRTKGTVEFDLTAVSPMHGGEPPVRDDQETMYGRDFSFGHFNQHTRTVGRMNIGGQPFEFDSYGWRDHSWGPRFWTNIYFYRLFVANFGPDRALMLLKITGRDGVTRRCGVLQFDGDYEDITDLDVYTEWTALKDPKAIRLGVRTAKRAVQLEGEVIQMAPLSNRRKVGDEILSSRIAEGLTMWTWGERTGIGVTEYIELLQDGQP